MPLQTWQGWDYFLYGHYYKDNWEQGPDTLCWSIAIWRGHSFVFSLVYYHEPFGALGIKFLCRMRKGQAFNQLEAPPKRIIMMIY